MLSGNITIYAVVPITVPNVTAKDEEGLIINALKQADFPAGFDGEIVRYELERPGRGLTVRQDSEHLQIVFEHQLNGAQSFSLLEEPISGERPEPKPVLIPFKSHNTHVATRNERQ